MNTNDENNNIIIDKEEENKVSLTAEMLKKHFELIRQRKYNLPRIFRFLEERFFEDYYLIPNFDINDYSDFSRDFDKMLDTINNKLYKKIIIDKYGLLTDKPLTYSEMAIKYNFSYSKIAQIISHSIIKIQKNTFYVNQVKSYFNLKSKKLDSQTKQSNIEFVLSIIKDLEEGEKND